MSGLPLKQGIHPYFAFALSLFGTTLAAFFSYQYFRAENAAEFNKRSTAVLDSIHSSLRSYTNLILHTKGLFDGTEKVTRSEFTAWVKAVDVKGQYPGVLGLIFAARVRPAERKSFERKMRESGERGFHIWPDSKHDAFPVTFIEPHEPPNLRPIGFDVVSDPMRRQAFFRARDTGRPAVTEKIALLQESGSHPQAGFLICAPLYKKGVSIGTVEQRQRALRGFISGPFRADDYFNAIISPRATQELKITFQVYAGDEALAEDLIHDHGQGLSELRGRRPDFSITDHFPFGGKEWTIVVDSLPGFTPAAIDVVSLAIFLLGTTFSLLLGRMMMRSRRSQSALTDAAARLEFLYDVSKQLFASPLNPESRIEALSKAVIPGFADWTLVVLLAPAGKFRNAALYGPPGNSTLLEFIRQKYPIGVSKTMQNSLNGETSWIAEVEGDYEQFSDSPQAVDLLRKIGFRSYLSVPIRTEERLIGAIGMLRLRAPFMRTDVEIAEELAFRAAVAIENSILFSEAQEAIRTRDEFISVASHELKTPLTTLKLQAQMLQRLLRAEEPLEPNRGLFRQMAHSSDQQTARLNTLVNDMLDVTRIRTAKLTLEKARVDLVSLIREGATRFADSAREAGSELALEPIAEREIRGVWDRFRIEQVFANLMTNAIKYGAGKPISIRVWKEDEKAFFSVQDHGIGIAPEAQKRIFQRFERAVSSQNISGLGLGLYIVRTILEAHGGKVSVKSAPNAGSTFTVELPLD